MTPAARARRLLDHPFAQHPVVRKVTGYSAGSVVAIVVSEAAFAATLGWAHTGTTIASAVGFAGGAIPNYILNRRWAWRDRRGRDRRSEVTLYMVVSLATFIVSAGVTHFTKEWATHVTADRGAQVALTTVSFFAVSALFFVIKFFIYETFVFRKHPTERGSSAQKVSGDAFGPPLEVRAESVDFEPTGPEGRAVG